MNEIMTANQMPDDSALEALVVNGDLARLSPVQRVQYYQQVCKSMGLNPLTRPFDYITLNGKLTLYARKDAADQLRKLHNVSISKPELTFQDDLIIVTVEGHDNTGRTDSEIGVVKKSDMRGDMANAIMKAVTKAKRRLTLSICGLGWLDETEVETIPDARLVRAEDVETEPRKEKPLLEGAYKAVNELGGTLVFDDNLPEMTLVDAMNVTNSEGVLYGNLDANKLFHMGKSLTKLKREGRATEEHLYKLSAIQTILAAQQNDEDNSN